MPGKWHQIAGKGKHLPPLTSLSACSEKTLGKKKPGSARRREETLIIEEAEERFALQRWPAQALLCLLAGGPGTWQGSLILLRNLHRQFEI